MKETKKDKYREALMKKWEATGTLNGLTHSKKTLANTPINNGGYSNNTIINAGSNITIGHANSTDFNITFGHGYSTNTTRFGVEGMGTINGNYSIFATPPNENEFTIDVSKGLVKFYDFSKKVSTYIIKKFKSLTINEEEHTGVSIERELEPGELTKIKDYLDGELLLEFTDDLTDRYGEKCVLEINLNFINFNGGVGTITIGNDLVNVQPLAVPTGQLLYMDYTYNGTDYVDYNNLNVTTNGTPNNMLINNGTSISTSSNLI